jgi:hypothetical protein
MEIFGAPGKRIERGGIADCGSRIAERGFGEGAILRFRIFPVEVSAGQAVAVVWKNLIDFCAVVW